MNYELQHELIRKVQSKNCNHSFHVLLRDYENLLKKTINHFTSIYRNVPLQYEDLWNYSCFYFYEIVNEYKFSEQKTFAKFAQEYLFYKLSNTLKSFVTKSNQVMNYSDSIEEESINNNESDEDNEIPEVVAIKSIDLKKLLTKNELKVIKYISGGKTYEQTAKIMKTTIEHVYQIFYRAKNKLVKAIDYHKKYQSKI